ncbi:LuxR C-terminal-related transcriptional regulator [Streptomyces sp. NPDC051310]|uniref:helix-turn-helix transcriptional regulator n=1 Tax=Streptomyces sp. NPDC051310 TaxID=3365649 RepID=UPI0037A3FED7
MTGIYGRSAELEAVAALLDGLRSGRGGALLIAAEPGMGRTALLRRAAADFTNGRAVYTKAVPAERGLPYSGVHALLCATGDRGAAGVLRSGLEPGGLMELLRGAGPAGAGPLLVCVDDAHLWDARSRAELGFAARRPQSPRTVGLLLSVAGHRERDPDFAGLPVLRPGPLGDRAAAALVDGLTGGSADPAVRDAILYEAGGNPALIEAVVARLTPAQLAGQESLPRPLADRGVLLRTFGSRLEGLAPDTGQVLLLAAAAEEVEPSAAGAETAVVLRAAREAGIGPEALDAAEAAGVIRVAGEAVQVVRFVSPLLRRAVLAHATLSRRRAAHAVLASVLPGERHTLSRLLHRAAAAEGTDARLADELAAAAGAGRSPGAPGVRAAVGLSRPGTAAHAAGPAGAGAEPGGVGAEPGDAGAGPFGTVSVAPAPSVATGAPGGGLGPGPRRDAAGAAAGAEPGDLGAEPGDLGAGPFGAAGAGLLERSVALARAAELTADEGVRADRSTAAAEFAGLAGRPQGARELLAAGRRAADAAVRGRAELLRGTLALDDGPVGDAHAMLRVAAATLGPYDPERALTARLAMADAAWAMGDVPACLAALAGDRLPGEPALAHDYRTGLRAALGARLEEAREPLRRVLARGAGQDDPVWLLRAGGAALVLGDSPAACRIHARALALARTRGLVGLLPRVLEHLAYAELRAGRHARARAHAQEGLRRALRAGTRNTVAHQHAILALVASVEGDAGAVAGHAGHALAVARPHGLAQAATLAEWAAARADLGRGRADDAAARLRPLVRPGPRCGHFGVRMLAVPCFVEAAVPAGQDDDARAAAEAFAGWAAQGVDPQAPAQLARCRALLAGPAEAEALYAEALDRHEEAGGDFERGRTLLLYGKWLRRRRRPLEARGRLRDALVAFERSGAHPWAEQTRAELRATGEASGPRREPVALLPGLTPQQLRIARCVAEGATNREVAARLSISPRTVDHHLRNVFALLQVRSRVELSRLMDRAERSGGVLGADRNNAVAHE